MLAALASLVLLQVTASAPAQSRTNRVWARVEQRLAQQNDVWFKDGEFLKNVQLLKFSFEINPHSYDVATNLGWMQENVEKYDEALATYIRYKNENPKDKDSALPEANFYFMRKAYAKVVPLLEPRIKLDPHANCYRLLAHSYERLGLLKDSKRVWDLYLSRHADDEAAKLNLKRVEKKLKGGS
jgi:tetratricopeptide (TPR) repeat protein